MKQAVFFTLLTLTLALLVAPLFLKAKSGPTIAKAINNVKQIGIAITEFEGQYGHFPLLHQHGDYLEEYPVQERADSNYLFGQLLASKVLDSEKVFSWRGANEGDDEFSSHKKNLEGGENQFAYISKAGNTHLNYDDFPSDTPIILAPMIEGTHMFDQNYSDWSRRMVYLKLDSSVSTCVIARNGKAIIDESKQLGLLDTGKDTIWGNRVPTIHHPLPYPNAPSDEFLQRQAQWKITKNILYAGFVLTVLGFFSIPTIKSRLHQPAP